MDRKRKSRILRKLKQKRIRTNRTTFLILDDDVISLILNCNPSQWAKLRRVSRKFRDIIDELRVQNSLFLYNSRDLDGIQKRIDWILNSKEDLVDSISKTISKVGFAFPGYVFLFWSGRTQCIGITCENCTGFQCSVDIGCMSIILIMLPLCIDFTHVGLVSSLRKSTVTYTNTK